MCLKVFVHNFFEQTIALIVICVGGGLGFFLYPSIPSADSALTSFTFLTAFQRSHEALGILFYILSLVGMYKIYQEKINHLWLKFFTLFSFVLAVFFYPFVFISYTVIVGSFLLYLQKGKLNISFFRYFLILTACGIGEILFLMHMYSVNSTFSGVLSLNLPTPNILLVLAGYGILIPLFIYQFFKIKKTSLLIFLNLWFFESFLLAYLPFGFSRFFLRGLFFPGVILGIYAIKEISIKSKIKLKICYSLFCIILSLTFLVITYQRIIATYKHNIWYFMPQEEYDGIEYLKNHSQESSGVLTSYKMGNIIPAYTNNSVYFGHYLETSDGSVKLYNAIVFYKHASTKDSRKFLKENSIQYVVFTEDEKINSGKKTINGPFLIPVFKNSKIIIYKVI